MFVKLKAEKWLLINSNRKAGFLGFLINIESFKILYEDLCKKESLPYIYRYVK